MIPVLGFVFTDAPWPIGGRWLVGIVVALPGGDVEYRELDREDWISCRQGAVPTSALHRLKPYLAVDWRHLS